MAWKRKFSGGLLAGLGFLLSPLSWWNDLVINLPLALAFAWIIGFLYKPLFEAALIFGYWLTNIVGLVLLHKGVHQITSEKATKYSWQSVVKDLGISLIYTGLIVLLLKLGILKPLTAYLGNDE
jgi:hypothetical protein